MTRREKMMALCVAGVLGSFGLLNVLRWAVVAPFKVIEGRISDERGRRAKLDARLRDVADVEQKWAELTGRTLSGDANAAEARFREDMRRLLDLHGLDEPKVSPGAHIRYKNGAFGVPLTISATGTLKEVAGFLSDVRARDYLVRLEKVRLTSDLSVITSINNPRPVPTSTRPSTGGRPAPRGRSGGGSLGLEGPELKLSISAMTLVLPKLPGVTHGEASDTRPTTKRGSESSVVQRVCDNNLFKPWQPPPAVVVNVPTTRETPATKPTTTVVVDPRRDADKLVVVGTVSLNDEPAALVRDDREKTQPVKEYYLDDEIDDGTLLLICPEGLVVEVQEGGGETKYFYPLGANFASREVLSPESHPEVWQELQREFTQ
jgi:hypothetical protein